MFPQVFSKRFLKQQPELIYTQNSLHILREFLEGGLLAVNGLQQ